MSDLLTPCAPLRPSWIRKIEVTTVPSVPVPGPCWLWNGAKSSGYGRATVNKQPVHLHRFTYELFVGPIPQGLHIDHLCRQPACCAPYHLEPVTPKVNAERGIRATKTHCPSGHKYSGDNLYIQKAANGYQRRVCRTCRDANTARHRAKRSAQRAQTWAKYAEYLPQQSDGEAAA